jgi:HAD superfamily hydrolase (TIGR01484 family)
VRVKPLSDWSLAARQGLIGVFTDIDDTLTTEGAISPSALQALANLRAAGLSVVPITGRPIGWSMPFAGTWPVDAIVAENGSAALQRIQGTVQKHYQQDAATRARHFAQMQVVIGQIFQAVPEARVSTDSAGRETDIAIDHSEHHALSAPQIAQVVELMRAAGMQATVSSIHVNGWFGKHDKLSGARWIVRTLWDRDLDQEMDRWVYVGDSTNDQCMFERFAHSVGVANIARFLPQLSHPPRYITHQARGDGFAEVARAVLQARG